MTEEENRPLFSKDLRNRMLFYLQATRKEGRRDLENIQTGINLIMDALLEM
jgi:hypothetical protein